MTTQVAMSRRVHRYKLVIRDHQEAKGKRIGTQVLIPMTRRRNIGEE